MKDVIFGSVIYPKAVRYLKDFLSSLENQSYKDFSLLLLNDGVNEDEINSIIHDLTIDMRVIRYDERMNPTELRIKLLEESLRSGARVLVLGDIDDTFASNRVEKLVVNLLGGEKKEFVYNKFLLEDGSEAMPQLPLGVVQIEDILEYNFLGLSNTALSLQCISEKFIDSLHECKTQVFDWYLFSRLLLRNVRGCFVDTATYYRLHQDNYIGIPSMTKEMIEKEVFVKKEHYASLANRSRIFDELVSAYRNRNYEKNSKVQQYYWWNLTRRKSNEI